ncbi:MAG TPA: hypothetical protein PLR41_18415 [Alphaproteobacteria bacterium]|nr:hypothetical protein [Alphaproteobacteria bacterium]
MTRLIRWIFVAMVFAGVGPGCSRDEPAAVQELVTVEPARVAYNNDFVVRVALQQRDGLAVSIFKAGAGDGAPAVTAQPLGDTGEVLTAAFGTVRLTPGKYFAAVTDKAGKRLAGAEFSVTSPDMKPRLRVMPESLNPGDPITVTLRRMSEGESGWIGIYATGEPNLAAYLARGDIDAKPDSAAIFEAADFAKALTPGKYEARLMRAGGYIELASTPFVVRNPDAKPALTLSSSRIKAGNPIIVAFKDAPGTAGDQIAIYKAGESAGGQHLAYLPTGGDVAGQVVFSKEKYRQKLPPGQYVLKLTTEEGSQELASARFWMIDANGAPQIAVARSRIKQGDPVEAFWTSAPENEGAWIGVFRADDPDPSRVLARQADAAMDGGVTFATSDFGGTLQPGEYKVRLMRGDGTGELASVAFTVLDPSAAPQVNVVTPVKSGEPIKVSWIGSPGNKRDWIGLYKAGASDTHQYIKWLYTEGAVDGEVTFGDSLPPGDYVARLLIDNGYKEFAGSEPFTVLPR